MDILNFIFRIGVVLAVYNFLWWLIMIGINVLRGGRPKLAFEVYFIKAIRYAFLADVIFLFTIHHGDGYIDLNDLFLTGLIMLMYFVGQIQKNKNRQTFFNVRANTNMGGIDNLMNRIKPAFDIRWEVLVVTLSMALFVVFYSFPYLAYNPISNWFLDSILNIEDTPVFGFIFKVIGFFFLLSILMKVFGSIMFLLTGGRRGPMQEDYSRDDDDHFDDFTEVK